MVAIVTLAGPAAALGQGAAPARAPRRQFVTISVDRLHTMPLHFKDRPLEQLTGTDLSDAQSDRAVDYESRDGLTTVTVHEFRRRNRGAGVTVYPLGAANGPALAVRAAYEELPSVRFDIDTPAGRESYALTGGRAYDLSVGLVVSDRPSGWGLGAHTLLLAGIGRIRSDLGDGTRYVAEGGGGVNVGPFGVQLVVKIGYNRLTQPRPHGFLTVPITLRGTLSF
jgi:hypothetical protein